MCQRHRYHEKANGRYTSQKERCAARSASTTSRRLLFPIEELEEADDGAILANRVSSGNAPLQISVEGIVVEGDIIKNPEALFKLGQQAKTLTTSNREHIRTETALKRENTELKRLLALKDRQLNNHVTVTLGEAEESFKKHYTPGDPQTKRNVEATVTKFIAGKILKDDRKVRGLGARKELAEITPFDIDQWLDDYPNKNKTSIIHLRAHLSVFFTTCQRVFDMAFTPFTSGKLKPRGDLLTIYKKRSPKAIKRVEHLRMLLDAFDDNLYWQSWVAFACLAGPRWHEQQALLASAIDLQAVPPRTIIQATEISDIKEGGNAVPVEQVILLPILKKFTETWEPDRLLAWPSQKKNRDRSGEAVPLGAWCYNTWGREMKKNLEKARLRSRNPDHELWRFGPDEWRHTFGTLLALSGKNMSEIAAWMRNSTEVVSACYVNFNPTDERVKDQLKWQ